VHFLLNTNQSKYIYIFQAFLLAICVALPITYIVDLVFPLSERPEFEITMIDFISIVVFSPLLETFLMVFVFFVIKKFTRKFSFICLTSSLLWAFLHSLLIPVWGLVTFFSFLIFSIAFQVWDKVSRKDAYIVVFSIHALVNLFAFTLSGVN
jgi:hypothetical protein